MTELEPEVGLRMEGGPSGEPSSASDQAIPSLATHSDQTALGVQRQHHLIDTSS